jgi:hypothetical protein
MKKKTLKQQPKKEEQKSKPRLKWQTGPYARFAEYKFALPYPFLLLCKLMNITPDQLLTDFMHNLSCGSWKREGRDMAKARLIEYFIEHKYGQAFYSETDIREIFKEMDAIGLLWPEQAKMKMMDLHAAWRDKYHTYWFKKWYRKPRRKLT